MNLLILLELVKRNNKSDEFNSTIGLRMFMHSLVNLKNTKESSKIIYL